MKKIIIGIIISSIFIWLSIRGVEYDKILTGLKDAEYIFLIPALVMIMSIAIFRSLRWGVILSPIEKISQKKLFPIYSVGLMAIILIPMRIGEFLKPYLISRRSRVSLSSGLATVFVERVLDSLTILFMLLVVIFSSDLPEWLIRSGYSLLFTFLVLVILMFLMYYKTELCFKFLRPVLSRLPHKISEKIEVLIKKFIEGFKIISNPKKLFYCIFYSVLIWTFSALAIFSLFLFQNFQLSLLSAFVVLVITIIGVSIPTAPGFLGNFQFACITALSLFGIPKSESFAFSMVYYFFGIVFYVLLGLICLPFMDNFLEDLKKTLKL
ncbi:lysylphosphatidylglycerol synthase transmembrane domain-containing protein [Candidatus Latescibacterota bacterium]